MKSDDIFDALKQIGVPEETIAATRRMPVEKRAYVISRAMYESARAYHQRICAEIEAKYPETFNPDNPFGVDGPDFLKACAEMDERGKSKEVEELRKLYEAACDVMVEAAEQAVRRTYPTRFSDLKVIFDQWRARALYGQLREQALSLCFQAPF
jgi:hypothetical protein